MSITDIQQEIASAWKQMNAEEKKHYIELSDLKQNRYQASVDIRQQ